MPTGCLSCHLVRISRACTTVGLGSDKRTPLLRDAVRAHGICPACQHCRTVVLSGRMPVGTFSCDCLTQPAMLNLVFKPKTLVIWVMQDCPENCLRKTCPTPFQDVSECACQYLNKWLQQLITFPVTNVCCFQSQYAQVSQQLLACTFLFSVRLKKPPSLLPMGAARVLAGSELQAPWVQGVGPAAGSPGELCQQELPAPLGPSSLSSRSPSPYAPTLHLHSKVAILHLLF